MAQMNKIRHEFIERDTFGNITVYASDLSVDIRLAGALCPIGQTIGIGATYNLAVDNPGRVDTGHVVKIWDPSVKAFVSGQFNVTNRYVSGGVWYLSLANGTGSAVTFSAGDRLVIDPDASTLEGRAAIWKDDTGSVPFSAGDFTDSAAPDALGVPSQALLANDGAIEFYTPEADVDLVVYDSTYTTFQSLILDRATGGRRETINPLHYGAYLNSTSDSWPGIQAAINDAQNDSVGKSVIHIPAGDYYISGQLNITGDNVEIWLDKDTVIYEHSSFASGQMFYITGANCVIRGGAIHTDAATYGITVNGTGATIEGVTLVNDNAAAAGIYVLSGKTKCDIVACELSYFVNYGVIVETSDYITVRDCHLHDTIGTSGIYVGAGAGTNSFHCDIVGNQINSIDGTGIHVLGNAATGGTYQICVAGNRLYNCGGYGIHTTSLRGFTIVGNAIYGNGGSYSGSGLDDQHGIYLYNSLRGAVSANLVQVPNGDGIAIEGLSSGSIAEHISVLGNVITYPAQAGITASYISELVLSSNTISGANLDGIELGTSADNVIVVGNILEGTLDALAIGGTYYDLDITAGAGTVEVGHNIEV